jgi:hypothetical protein
MFSWEAGPALGEAGGQTKSALSRAFFHSLPHPLCDI